MSSLLNANSFAFSVIKRAISFSLNLHGSVDFLQGAASGSTIHVGNTQIMITNQLVNQPFCFANTPGTACVDVIDGFDFKFTGENILGVSVDASSAAAVAWGV